MLAPVLAAVIPVLAAIGLGYCWVRGGRPLENAVLTPLVVDIGTPCLILATFLKIHISPASFGDVAAAALLTMTGFWIVGYATLKLLQFRVRTFLPSLMFPNNGNMGLPVAAYAFGNEGLGYAIVIYATVMIGQFTIGQAIAAGGANWRGIFRLPLVYATAIGVLVSAAHMTPPAWLTNAISLVGGMTIPLMLLMLGASLARLGVTSLGKAALLSAVRIGCGGVIGYAVASALHLQGAAYAVVIMQAAMPVAVYNYLFAQKWNNEPEEVAGLVVASTLASIVTIPALLFLLIS